jgi:hypothetical protein
MSTDNKNEKFVRGSDQLLRYQEDQIRRESGVTAGPDDTEFAMETTMLPMAQTSSPLTVKSYEEEADSRGPLATSKVVLLAIRDRNDRNGNRICRFYNGCKGARRLVDYYRIIIFGRILSTCTPICMGITQGCRYRGGLIFC